MIGERYGTYIQGNITQPQEKIKWMNLEIIMLKKIIQTEKVENRIISLICGI